MKSLAVFLLILLFAGCYTEFGSTQKPPPAQNAITSSTYNPCLDSLFLALRAKPVDQLTEREFEMLKIREKACADYQNQTQRGEQTKDIVAKSNDSWAAVRVIAGLVSLASLIVLLK